MYRIGIFSKMNKVTIKTLRYYDEVGLLKPSHVDEATGFRYYSASQMPRLHQILMLRNIGFSINEIMQAVEQDIPADVMIGYLEEKQGEVSEIIRNEQTRLLQIQSYLAYRNPGTCENQVNSFTRDNLKITAVWW